MEVLASSFMAPNVLLCKAWHSRCYFPFAHKAYVFYKLHIISLWIPHHNLVASLAKAKGTFPAILPGTHCLILVFTLGAFTLTSSVCCPCSSDSILCVGSSTSHADSSIITHHYMLLLMQQQCVLLYGCRHFVPQHLPHVSVLVQLCQLI